MSAPEVLGQFSSKASGLDANEASKRLEHYGLNQLVRIHKTPWIVKYFQQYKDLMVVLLVISSIISFSLSDQRTAIVLLILVGFNTLLGFVQEYKAEQIMDSLDRLIVPRAKVLRDGKVQEIASTELVPGDIVCIEEGDSVPADLRLIEEDELATNDFALTGESNPSRKFIHTIEAEIGVAGRHNLVFMGTTVAIGSAKGVVIATSMQTELGRIASLSQETTADLSPLQKEMNHVATRVTQGTVLLCAALLPIAIQADLGIKDAFLFVIGIASSLIPQGLPAEINTTLSQAANKLAKARALIKKLSSVETLGSTTIICTDKTGTLTQNQMTVVHLVVGETEYETTGTGYENNGTITNAHHKALSQTEVKDLELFFAAGSFASNAHINPPDDEHASWYCLGDPTEGALITLARKAGLEPEDLNGKFPELKEFGFDSARKRISSVRAWDNNPSTDQKDKLLYLFVKGAPESILEKCTDFWDGNHARNLTEHDKNFVTSTNKNLAESAMRNLGLAYRILPANTNLQTLTLEEAEQDLTYLGMVSMVDPLRDEVHDAMQAAHDAHIKVAIITGDFAPTAQAIANKAGLGTTEQQIVVVSGEEMSSLSDAQMLQLASRGSVIFSRVSPEDKLRIVGLLIGSGEVVAVTGDGINDAPALKRADIGVAMGKTGTDVAKQSAEIVLLDDSFHTLVGAVQQGRVIFNNIKKGTLSAFTSNAAELVVNLVSLAAFSLFHIPLALSVMEILAIDLIAELFPIAALGWDHADHEVMHEHPRNMHDHIINKKSILDLLWCGILMGGFAFINFMLLFQRHGINPQHLAFNNSFHMQATALTYLTIVLCQLGNILQRRSKKGIFTKYQLHNGVLWGAMALSMFCVFNIIYNPWIAPYFGAGPLSVIDWLYALGAAALFITIREIQRTLTKNKSKLATATSQ